MVDSATADWLKSEGLKVSSTNGAAASFSAAPIESVVRCCFDTAADAVAESGRQIAFLGAARVIELLRVDGQQAGLIGQTVTLTAAFEGYRLGADVFVIGAKETDDNGTELRVIRRLA